ncbi:XynA Beta-1,4-xylanase [Rhabdaerophilaceae bacterium]
MMPHLSRRAVLRAGAALPLAAGLPAHANDRLPLWAAAQRSGILFGASAAWETIRDAAYGALQAEHSRLLAADVALKFDYLRPREDVFDFEQPDALLAFARAHGMAFRGTAMIWNDWPAPWLKNKSSAEIERIFDQHIDVVAGRYAGAIQSWDAVNEPFWPGAGKPGGFRPGPWYDAMGEDYIFRSFKRLAQVDRHAKLVLNEAFTEQNDELGKAVRQRMLLLIDRMLDRGLKLDVVGLQAHIRPAVGFNIDAFLRFIDEIATRKLDIYLTEFDIEDVSLPRELSKRDEIVADWTSRFLEPVLRNQAVKVVITWHLADKYTWYREPAVVRERNFRFPARPLPFDDQFHEKRMGRAMRAAFLGAPRREFRV